MEACLKLPNRYAMIFDSETINRVVAHAAALKLSRRECHPLDRYRGKCADATLAKYDAEVDAAPLAAEELELIEAEEPSVSPGDESADEDF